MDFNKKKNVEDFIRMLPRLRAAEILGLAQLLKVNVFYADLKDEKGHPAPRSGESVIEDCIVKFGSLDRAERRHILRILRAASKKSKRGEQNGVTTEH